MGKLKPKLTKNNIPVLSVGISNQMSAEEWEKLIMDDYIEFIKKAEQIEQIEKAEKLLRQMIKRRKNKK